mmetsp:Transcript_3843/g.13474  ORF Transcript_3843/g.13474 Transcript_3843/m.13474 type:complete len:213 (-) Transcript_3843:965-1603(-)
MLQGAAPGLRPTGRLCGAARRPQLPLLLDVLHDELHLVLWGELGRHRRWRRRRRRGGRPWRRWARPGRRDQALQVGHVAGRQLLAELLRELGNVRRALAHVGQLRQHGVQELWGEQVGGRDRLLRGVEEDVVEQIGYPYPSLRVPVQAAPHHVQQALILDRGKVNLVVGVRDGVKFLDELEVAEGRVPVHHLVKDAAEGPYVRGSANLGLLA